MKVLTITTADMYRGGISAFLKNARKKLSPFHINLQIIYKNRALALIYGNRALNPQLPRKYAVSYLLDYMVFLVTSILASLRVIKCSKIVYVHDTGNGGLVGGIISLMCRIPLVTHVHGYKFKEISIRRKGFLRKIYIAYETAVERFVIKRSSKVLFSSKILMNVYSRVYKWASDKFTYIPVGIDVKKFDIAEVDKDLLNKIGIRNKVPVIGYIGRVEIEKNLGTALKALSSLKKRGIDFRFLIVGSGSQIPVLKELARKLSVEREVMFLGYRRDVKKVLSVIDIFLLPSLTEGTPLSLLEAMAAGKPVAVSSLPTLRYIVRDGVEGCLFNPFSHKDIERCIVKLLREDRSRLGKRARERIVHEYNIDIIARRIANIFYKLALI